MRRLVAWLAIPTFLTAVGVPMTLANTASSGGQGIVTSTGLQDPTGDATGRDAAARRRADINKVRYVAPRYGNQRLWMRVQFDRLQRPRPEARLGQSLTLDVRSANGERSWTVTADNLGDDVTVTDVLAPDGENEVDVEHSRLVRTYGKNGSLSIRLSIEWLPSSVVGIAAYSSSGSGRDQTRPLRLSLGDEDADPSSG